MKRLCTKLIRMMLSYSIQIVKNNPLVLFSMIKGQVVSGDFSKIVARIKTDSSLEIGELVVIDNLQEKFILQVYDLAYGSQISQQNLEMVAGMNLEEGNFSILDEKLRNYQMALLKPILTLSNGSKMCKKLPSFFSTIREIGREDLSFITKPLHPLFLGKLRSGSKEFDFDILLPGKEVLSHHVLIPASTGKGKSNLMSCILWDVLEKDYAGMLVLDPHDEYYGRTSLGLKDHPAVNRVSYYTPVKPPAGARTLKININKLKPDHFQGAIGMTDPQRQCLFVYYKKFGSNWIVSLLKEEWIEMDHKLIRIATGVLIFVLSALFWLYFFKSTSPFHF